jgi:hypothetical protein
MPSRSSSRTSRGRQGDVLGGALCAGSLRLPRRGAEHAGGGAAFRPPPQHATQDAGACGAAGLPAKPSAFAAQARRLHGDHRRDPGGGPFGAGQAAAHGEADSRAAAGRARLCGRLHDREELPPRAARPHSGGVRSARPCAGPRAGRFWRGDRDDRWRRADDPRVLPRSAALGRVLRQGVSGGAERGLPRRPQRRVRLLRRRAAHDPVRQHQAGGGAHPR